ncbi:MAG: hypothetical protein KDA84_10320, partial [Planctomycetaceae bacterium]|nr:hypothetical protein [Planctomycetaceae bacterium]
MTDNLVSPVKGNYSRTGTVVPHGNTQLGRSQIMQFCAIHFCKSLRFACLVTLAFWGGQGQYSPLFAQLPAIQPGGQAPQKAKSPQTHENWEVIYLGANRIGYSHAKTRQIEFEGKPAFST